MLNTFMIDFGVKAWRMEKSDPEIANYFKGILENFRDQMKTGIPEQSVPIMEPFKYPNKDVFHYVTE